MIIVAEPCGDHSNRLFQSIHYEAYCLDRGISFMNLTFDDMVPNYPALKVEARTKAARILTQILLKARLAPLRTDLKVKSDLDKARTGWFTLVGGFDFRVHDLTEKYRDYFVEKYSMDKSKLADNGLANDVAQWKAAGMTVVGVHLRRGDYKRFKNGIYFYSDAVYEGIMRAFEAQIAATGSRAKFLLFSNESFSIAPGGNLNCTFSRNDWLTDHHLMGLCDYLVGPPSTFTFWASYMGKVPVMHIHDPAAPISLDALGYCPG